MVVNMHKRKAVPIIFTILVVIAALSMLSGKDGGALDTYAAGSNYRDLILLLNERPDEGDFTAVFGPYEKSVDIKKHVDDFLLVSVKDNGIYGEVVNYLENNPVVKSVEPDAEVQLMQYTKDTYTSAQWPIYNPGYYSVYSGNKSREILSAKDVDMDVAEAWEFMEQENAERKEVIVAIIDTGVDYTHPDLADHIWVNKDEIPGDGIDNDKNGYVDDIYGWDFYNDDASVCHYKYNSVLKLNLALPEDNDDHGTHIAGIIGAVANNGIGIAGIASNIDIKLMILKINGGASGTGSISDAVLAIKYATRMGADICNISWGTTQYSSVLKEAIRESDMLFVAAAGNSGRDNDTRPVYPASFMLDNIISVTFLDPNGKLTKLSNYGKGSVEIAAPGVDIMSTAVGTYQTLSGSSMAAPHVTAVASLLYSYNKNMYPQAVKDIIIKTLKPFPELESKLLYPGIPSAYNAVREAANISEDITPPIIDIDVVFDKENILVPLYVTDEGSGIRVIRWLAGRWETEDFARGTAGLEANNNYFRISKAGEYTIYASDYAGNEIVQRYDIEDDVTPPVILYSYRISEDYSQRTVNIRVIDGQSGIRRVKYMPGKRNASSFLPAGSGVEMELKGGKVSFNVSNDGIYTLYAIDNRGNQVVEIIDVKTIIARDIKFIRKESVMNVGEESYIRASIKPANTTDVITYTSSDESIAVINNKGKVTALKEGTVTITARTNSGLKATCKVVVRNPQQ